MGLPVRTSADLIWSTVQLGCRWRSSAAAPATCGEAMLVPLQASQPFGTDDSTPTPGAETSGFSWSEIGVGPPDENPSITRELVTAADVIARGALPGEPTDPRPNVSKSLPAAIAGTTPAAAAPLIAFTTMSRLFSISGSPSERLITSIPSATAASIPLAISGAFPSGPTRGVGIVRTL